MEKALLLSILITLTLGCSLPDIVYEATGTGGTGGRGKGAQPQLTESRQEQPTAEYRSHNNPAANENQDTSPPSQNEEFDSSSIDSFEANTIYIDDFSSSEGGWDIQSSENSYADYIDNSFHIAVYSTYYDVWANPDFYYGNDAQIKVDATLIGGEDDNNFGVLCRYTGAPSSPSFYFFEISSDGYAVIGKVIDGEPEYISSAQMMPSSAINQGYATNHLRADCIGSQLDFYVNGRTVMSTTDYSLPSGGVGLIAGTFDAAYTEIAFDDFIVVVP